jgi:hypothetical protein
MHRAAAISTMMATLLMEPNNVKPIATEKKLEPE